MFEGVQKVQSVLKFTTHTPLIVEIFAKSV